MQRILDAADRSQAVTSQLTILITSSIDYFSSVSSLLIMILISDGSLPIRMEVRRDPNDSASARRPRTFDSVESYRRRRLLGHNGR